MKIKDLQVMIKEAMGDKPVLLAKPDLLTEASYWRVKDKIENQMVPFAMISAFRGGNSRSENMRNQKELEGMVADAKFPWTKMPGSGYVEDPGEADDSEEVEINATELAEGLEIEETEEESEPEGVEVKENSIIIWNEERPDKGPRTSEDRNLFELAKFLAKKYGQDSFIYGEPITGEASGERQMLIKLYDKTGTVITDSWAGPWTTLTQIQDDDLFWSAIGSKKAKLTEMLDRCKKVRVRSRLDAMKKQHYLTAIKSALKRV